MMRNKMVVFALGLLGTVIVVVALVIALFPKEDKNPNTTNVDQVSEIGDVGRLGEEEIPIVDENGNYVIVEEDEYEDVAIERESEYTRDASELTESDLAQMWSTFLTSDNTYEKVKTHNTFLEGMKNLTSTGDADRFILNNILDYRGDESSGFTTETLEIGGRKVRFYQVVLPASATLPNARSSAWIVLEDTTNTVGFIYKKDNQMVEWMKPVGEYLIIGGRILDGNIGGDNELNFVRALHFSGGQFLDCDVKTEPGLDDIVTYVDQNVIKYSAAGNSKVDLDKTGNEIKIRCGGTSATIGVKNQVLELAFGETTNTTNPNSGLDFEIPTFD